MLFKSLPAFPAKRGAPEERPVGLVEIAGRVKWFDVSKGYGFIVPDSGEADVLIHVTVLRRDGFQTIYEGARVVAEAQRRDRGIAGVPRAVGDAGRRRASAAQLPPARTRAQAASVGGFEIVIVKWFNRARGFGFLTRGEGTEDIFVHMETLRRYGFVDPQAGRHACSRASGRARRGCWRPKCGRSTARESLVALMRDAPAGPASGAVDRARWRSRAADARLTGARWSLGRAWRWRSSFAALRLAPALARPTARSADHRHRDRRPRFPGRDRRDDGDARAGADVSPLHARRSRHAVRVRARRAGHLLDEEHLYPARHDLHRPRRRGDADRRQRRAACRRRSIPSGGPCAACSNSTAASRREIGLKAGDRVRHPFFKP